MEPPRHGSSQQGLAAAAAAAAVPARAPSPRPVGQPGGDALGSPQRAHSPLLRRAPPELPGSLGSSLGGPGSPQPVPHGRRAPASASASPPALGQASLAYRPAPGGQSLGSSASSSAGGSPAARMGGNLGSLGSDALLGDVGAAARLVLSGGLRPTSGAAAQPGTGERATAESRGPARSVRLHKPHNNTLVRIAAPQTGTHRPAWPHDRARHPVPARQD